MTFTVMYNEVNMTLNVRFFEVLTMTDLMKWMYDHYIKPQIESQPKNFGEAALFDLLSNELDPDMRQHLQKALSYYAVQGFRLGVRTRIALNEDLR